MSTIWHNTSRERILQPIYDLLWKKTGEGRSCTLICQRISGTARTSLYVTHLFVYALPGFNISFLQDKSYSKEATKSFEKLAGLFPETQSKEGKPAIAMVVYIDAAHTLGQMISHSTASSMFDHMLKAIADLSSIPVFFLFLSTDPQLEVAMRQPGLPHLARFRGARRLVTPFTGMPFDCHSTLVKGAIQPELALEDVQEYSFIVRFGRPL